MTSIKPWTAEKAISLQEAKKLIENQFPELMPLQLELLGNGWDNTAYLANNSWVFRFPRKQDASVLMQTEIKLLPQIQNRLPILIPNPIFVGKPNEDYPWPFAGYEQLQGTPASSANLSFEERVALAKPLALFLKALHSVSHDEAVSLGATYDDIARLDVTRISNKTESNLKEIQELGLARRSLQGVGGGISAASGKKVLCHGDFYAKHILLNPQKQFCAVIDWGDIHVGYPAIDLQVVYSFLPPQAHEIFFENYGPVDQTTRELMRLRALFSLSTLLLYAHHQADTDLFEESRQVLMNFF